MVRDLDPDLGIRYERGHGSYKEEECRESGSVHADAEGTEYRVKELTDYDKKMRDRQWDFLCFVILVSLILSLGECKKKKGPEKKPSSSETTLFNFLRLVVYRLIYGFATMFGAQEGISEFMGGMFVPPGADEDGDYRDYLDDDYRDYGDGYDY